MYSPSSTALFASSAALAGLSGSFLNRRIPRPIKIPFQSISRGSKASGKNSPAIASARVPTSVSPVGSSIVVPSFCLVKSNSAFAPNPTNSSQLDCSYSCSARRFIPSTWTFLASKSAASFADLTRLRLSSPAA